MNLNSGSKSPVVGTEYGVESFEWEGIGMLEAESISF